MKSARTVPSSSWNQTSTLHSESNYLSCWNLYDPDNKMRMWYRYAPCGVAVRSEYGRLRAAVAMLLDEVHVGRVRYGDEDMTSYNALQILFTKSHDYVARTRSGLSCAAMTQLVDRLATTARRASPTATSRRPQSAPSVGASL
jgi:hypothetical protein